MAITVLAVSACGSPPPPERPMSWTDHMTEAQTHDARADRHVAMAARESPPVSESYRCGDDVLQSQSTSGGEPVSRWMPCWTVEQQSPAAHRAEAERERREARLHRAMAHDLVEAERKFCAQLPPDELTHTPFWHREDVVKVEPLMEQGQMTGATVTFRKVGGLTAGWMRAALGCHQARAALHGYDVAYLGYDPSMVAGATTTVRETKRGIEVSIHAPDRDGAERVFQRAMALRTGRLAR